MVHSACFAGLRFGSRNYCTSLPAEPDSFDVERGEGFPAYRFIPIPRDRFERLHRGARSLLRQPRPKRTRIRLKEKESLAHQRSVVNAGEMFQLSYTGFLGGSFRRGALSG